MNNKEIVFLMESTKRNSMGNRKIQVRKNIYDQFCNVQTKILKTFDTVYEAKEWMISKGWSNKGYVKDLITGEVTY